METTVPVHLRFTPLAAGLCSLLVGCPESTTPSSTAETGSALPLGCATQYDGPITLTAVGVACAPDGTVTLTADTEAWTGDGVIFAMDTANADPWTEEHDLPEVGFDPCGAWDHLERTLLTREYGTTGADTDAYVRNESSFFTCEQHWGTPVMTYAFVAQDAAGNLADCWVVGADPTGLAAGAYASDYNVAPTHDLTSCEVGTLAR